MTAAERFRLKRAVSDARRAAIRFAPTAGARNPALARVPSPEELERIRARERAWKARAHEIVVALDDWQWEAA